MIKFLIADKKKFLSIELSKSDRQKVEYNYTIIRSKICKKYW